MWKCRKCSTENPNQSAYCQTCGERQEDIKGFTAQQENIKEFTVQKKTEKTLQEMNIEKMYIEAEKKIPRGDYSALELYAKVVSYVGVATVIALILQVVVTIVEFNFMYLIGLITTATIGISCFVVSNLIELVIDLKNEINFSTRSSYVNAQINKQLLDTLKEIKEQSKK